MSRRHGRTQRHERGHSGAPRPGSPAGPRPNRATERGPGQVAPPPVASEQHAPAQPARASAAHEGRSTEAPVQSSAAPVESPAAPVPVDPPADPAPAPTNGASMTDAHPASHDTSSAGHVPAGGPPSGSGGAPSRSMGQNGHGAPHGPAGQNGHPGQNGQPGPSGADRGSPCTAPQLRRFIKSRPYVPMHELRRRFAINGDDDDVSSIQLDPGCIFVGLPTREGQLLGELLRAGEIGYELSLDPRTPIVVGVYPMRPVPRP
jgi:hypothetical protein